MARAKTGIDFLEEVLDFPSWRSTGATSGGTLIGDPTSFPAQTRRAAHEPNGSTARDDGYDWDVADKRILFTTLCDREFQLRTWIEDRWIRRAALAAQHD